MTPRNYDDPANVRATAKLAQFRCHVPYTHAAVSAYFICKWQERARDAGNYHAAVQMRKQGIPLFVALAILTRIR